MDNFCRGCLTLCEPCDLFQYTEKNRRLFVYSTGIQVKRNDSFIFQLCKQCCINMKTACNFKKNCRNSDKKLKSYIENKESGESVDISTYLKNYDDSLKFRLPLNIGNSTPPNNKIKDDDNESTCTSIQNFMTDILKEDEIPDNEARIICEVIEEEADILEDSLDSHWLQDDVSVDSDFRLDFSFSAFSTPRSIASGYFSPKKFNDILEEKNIKEHKQNLQEIEVTDEKIEKTDVIQSNKSMPDLNLNSSFDKPFDLNDETEGNKCIIDVNLENALKNDSTQKVMLDKILMTPPVIPTISAPSTPLITNILFGDKLEDDVKIKPENETRNNQEDIDVLDKFLNINDSKENSIEFDDSLMDLDDIENIQTYLNNESGKCIEKDNKRESSPVENKYCITNFYCKMCDRQFKNLVALKVHCAKYHKFKIESQKSRRVRKKYICDFCGKIFMSSRCITKHLANHQKLKTYECEKCMLKFATESQLSMHMSSHTGIRIKKTVSKKYICSDCGAICTSSSNFNSHKRRHLKKFIVHCEECGKGFYRASDLTVHMRHHTGERPYGCNVCDKAFTRQDILTRHMKRHTGEKPFSCQFCEAKFCKSYDLKLHQSRSKLCLKQQQYLVQQSTENAMNDILITEAFVF